MSNYTTIKRNFKHLTSEKRAQIEILLKTGMSKICIAKTIGIARSTLYEELKRGTTEQLDSNLKTFKRYFSELGHKVYLNNRKNSIKPYKAIQAHKFLMYAQEKILNEKMSPDAVCGFAKRNNLFESMVCTKTLYNYIDRRVIQLKNIDLLLKVKRKTKLNKNRKNKKIYGESIEHRPISVQNRLEFGHWEIDTVVGSNESSYCLLTLDERLSRYRIIEKIHSRSAAAVSAGIKRIFDKYSKCANEMFKTITADNGCEFASLQQNFSSSKIYYAHPYSSFERGTNERQNGIIRRFFPKGKSFDNIPDETILLVQNYINSLPRKIFNYRCSNDFFSLFVNFS